MDGRFPTSGPPVVWQMRRRPATLTATRATLLPVFVLDRIVRLGLPALSTLTKALAP